MSDVTLNQVIAEADMLPPDEQKELFRYLEKKINRQPLPEWPITPPIVRTCTPKDRSKEDEWFRQHRDEYVGQWIALDGDRLLGHNEDFKVVATAARNAGVADALIFFVELRNAPDFVVW